MPIFYYTAKSQKGKKKTGTLAAKDKHNLAQTLRKKGYILISAENLEQKKSKKNILKTNFSSIFRHVPLVEKLMFTRHLSVMIGAGFSLNQGLEVLAKQTKNQFFKKIINQMINNLKQGQNLGDSLAKYPRVFNNFFVSMVRVGEKGGNLQEVLKILAEHMKKEHELRSKIKGAMFYPVIILIAMVAIITLMMVVVIPKLMVIFQEMEVELPVTTKALIAISSFITNYFYLGIVIILALIIILGKFFKTKQGKKVLSWLFINLPLFGKITKKINCARFARSFSSLMESGVPIVESLNVSAQTLTNVFYSDSLIKTAEEVKKGNKIQPYLRDYRNLYPVLVTQMIGVGEQTGELSDIMQQLADFYEEEVTDVTENLTSVIEPILMIILGAAVAFFAISIIQPMYSMMGTL